MQQKLLRRKFFLFFLTKHFNFVSSLLLRICPTVVIGFVVTDLKNCLSLFVSKVHVCSGLLDSKNNGKLFFPFFHDRNFLKDGRSHVEYQFKYKYMNLESNVCRLLHGGSEQILHVQMSSEIWKIYFNKKACKLTSLVSSSCQTSTTCTTFWVSNLCLPLQCRLHYPAPHSFYISQKIQIHKLSENVSLHRLIV